MNETPRVTVLMPVYNGEEFLREAVESILGQTFPDFELLVINDGSTDGSAEILRNMSDPRMRLVHNERNMGLIATLNRGFELAQGEYLARMDCDDVSRPERLARQVDYLDRNRAIGLCGAWFRKFGPGGDKVVRWETEPEGVRASMLFASSVAHPTVMLRREAFVSRQLRYDPEFPHAEDYDLWARAMSFMDMANLPEVLLDYRVHPHQVTQRLSQAQVESAGKVRLRLLREAGFDPSPEEFRVHQAVSICAPLGIDDLFRKADEWLCTLKRRNDMKKVYREPDFSRLLLERWIIFVKKCWGCGGASRRYAIGYPLILKETGLGLGSALRVASRLRG
jgi:hypothetical protein